MASYKLKTDGIEFEVAKSAAPKTDNEGRQKVDVNSGYPVWVVELTAWKGEDEGADTLSVSVAASVAPAVKWRQPVEVVAAAGCVAGGSAGAAKGRGPRAARG